MLMHDLKCLLWHSISQNNKEYKMKNKGKEHMALVTPVGVT